MTTTPTRRRHPSGRVIAVLWAVLAVAAIAAAVVFHDDDPTTDDGAAWGALLGLVGGCVTGVYVAVSVIWVSSAARGSSRRRRLVEATAVGGAIVLAAAAFVGYAVWSSRDADLSVTAADPTTPRPVYPIAAVTDAALATSDKTIIAVGCAEPVETDEIAVLTCVVTYAEPSCQLWVLGGDNDPDPPLPLGDPIAGRRGVVDEATNRARCV